MYKNWETEAITAVANREGFCWSFGKELNKVSIVICSHCGEKREVKDTQLIVEFMVIHAQKHFEPVKWE